MANISADPYAKEQQELDATDFRVRMYKEFPEEADLIMKHTGRVAPPEVYIEAYALLHKPRGLDKMPPPVKTKSDVGIPSGISEIFKVKYASIVTLDNEEITGVLQVPNGNRISCDIAVIKTLKTLMTMSASQNEEAQRAVVVLIPHIMRAIMGGSYLTKMQLSKVIEDLIELEKGYYSKELMKSIVEVLSDGENNEPTKD